MKEIVKSLATEAGMVMYPTGLGIKENTLWGDRNIEKFAELIVKECAELIDNKVMITGYQTYDAFFVAKFDTKEQCAKQILEHFGVE